MTFYLTRVKFTNYEFFCLHNDCEHSSHVNEARMVKCHLGNPYTYSDSDSCQCECALRAGMSALFSLWGEITQQINVRHICCQYKVCLMWCEWGKLPYICTEMKPNLAGTLRGCNLSDCVRPVDEKWNHAQFSRHSRCYVIQSRNVDRCDGARHGAVWQVELYAWDIELDVYSLDS